MKKKRLLSIAALCLVVTLCLSTLCFNIIFKDNGSAAQAAAVSPGTASVLNLDDKGIAQNYFSSVITGKQNEYIYLGENLSSDTNGEPGYYNKGTYKHTGAVKWRVLSTTDTKYNSVGGTWLLWADYSLGCGPYNDNHTNKYYSFWSDSQIRAKLNGNERKYIKGTTSTPTSLNTTVANAQSWLYQVFKKQAERDSFVPTTEYSTFCSIWYSDNINGCQAYATQGIVGAGSLQYTTTMITKTNSLLTAAGNMYAKIEQTGDSGVKELTSNDYLFLIDYDDINNTNYGFGEFVKSIDSAWTSSEASGYYLYSSGGSISATASYLAQNDINDTYYFLRPAQVYKHGSVGEATAIGVTQTGRVDPTYMEADGGPVGIRPAFNFSPSSVIYATAADMSVVANPSSGGDTFTAVSAINGSKPAYKVYLKSSSYKNYSDGSYSDLPKVTTGGSTVSVEKSGQSGSAVFLLADPSGNGEVKYQATANFNSGKATANLPSGVKASDHVVTVLFLDGTARGDELAETVTASYTNNTFPEIKDSVDTLYYTGSGLDFKLKYFDGDVLDVTLTDYLGLNGVTALPTNTSSSASNGELTFTAIDVGKYTVKVKPKTGKYWYDGTTVDKEYVLYVKHKVKEPVFTDSNQNSITKTYDKTEQSLAISNYDKDLMDVKASAVADLTFDGNASPPVFKVTKAKTYNVSVELKDKTLMEWSTVGDTSDKTLTVTMNKLKIAKPALSNPTETSKTYVSSTSPITFGLTNLGGLTNSYVTITAPTNPTGASLDGTDLKMTNAGTYSFSVALADKDNTEWTDGTALDYNITVTVTKKKVTKPTVSGDTTKPYTGTTVTFPLLNYTSGGDVTIDAPSSPTGANVNGSNLEGIAVGTYNFTVKLADANNTEWSDSSGSNLFTLPVIIGSGQISKPSLASGTFKDTDSKAYASGGVTFSVYNVGTDVTITAPSGSDASISGSTITVTKVGTYAFTVALADSTNTEWTGGGKDSYTLTVTVTRLDVTVPAFASGADKRPYNGSEQTFNLTIDSTLIEIKDSTNSTVTSFKATNAGTYTYTLNLKDTDNTQWAGTSGDVTPKNISITVDKKTLNITSFTCSVSGSTPIWEKGTSGVTFTAVEDSLTGDTVKLRLYIEDKNGVKTSDFAGVDESVAKTVTVTIPNYLDPGNYKLGIELAPDAPTNSNSNYVLTTLQSQIIKAFVVKGQGLSLTEENMPWIYKYTDSNQIEQKVDILAESGVTARKAHLTYTGYEYEFGVDTDALAVLGAEIDTTKGTNGFDGTVKYTNATTVSMTVTVYWKPKEGYDGTGGSYTLTYEIEKAKYDLTNTKWDYSEPKQYNPLQNQTVKIINLPSGLSISDADYADNRYKAVGDYTAKVLSITNSDSNYVTPSLTDKETYIYDGNEFPWTLDWKIIPKKLSLNWVEKNSDNNDFIYWEVSGDEAERIDSYLFYKDSDYDSMTGTATGTPITLSDITVTPKKVDAYWVVAKLKDETNYEIESNKAKRFTVGSLKDIVKVELKGTQPYEYDGKAHGSELNVITDGNTLTSSNIVTKYYKDSVSESNLLTAAPTNAGRYVLVMSLQAGLEEDYELIVKTLEFEIAKAKITATWDTSGSTPKLTNGDKYKDIIGYVYYDADGNELEEGATLEKGKTYKVKAIIKGENGANYEFVADDGVTVLEDPTTTDEEEFTVNETPNNDDNNVKIDLGNIGNIFKEYWQAIASGISILLIIIFLSKALSYESRRKRADKTAKERYKTYYAAATGLFGLATTYWNVIAGVLMGLAVVSFVIMIIAKNRCVKAEDNLAYSKEEYEKAEAKRRDEDMKMMFMGMMGGNNGQGGFTGAGLGAEDIRGIVSETMTAMLPGMQQLLPQQASVNDEMMQKLIEKEEKNDETIKRLMQENADNQKAMQEMVKQLSEKPADNSANDELVQKLIAQNEKLMQQLAEKPTEKIIEKEVAAASANDELLRQLVEKSNKNDETISKLMEKLVEMSANQRQQVVAAQPQVVTAQPIVPAQPQIIERVVEKPVEKIVEKEVRVEVPVEKVVEKPVIHVISTEAAGGAEKSKQVKAAPKKEAAPRLTLEEAYAKLTKEQKKYFDGLREYAMKKDSKCKEKLATYFTTIGPSTTNPLIKLTIKKGVTVALFKMEDEYLKDIRRNAGSDGTKVKVKETEVPIGDAQAFDTAKDMVDLRVDQIERYDDFMKEQRAMKRK